ncbi:hypothetical protein [Campylobacter sp. RM16192]|uniref:hypothetical protein n=1 Tax=Campylobacter sp. RM16192 TaxID=1660080 RepID=UPI00159903F5|nr:hypothetical protein [Campylobacter sp. RM16192]QKU36248.1 hypothetical protein CDOMC_a036 [Campylobacter sp. RM16192]
MIAKIFEKFFYLIFFLFIGIPEFIISKTGLGTKEVDTSKREDLSVLNYYCGKMDAGFKRADFSRDIAYGIWVAQMEYISRLIKNKKYIVKENDDFPYEDIPQCSYNEYLRRKKASSERS